MMTLTHQADTATGAPFRPYAWWVMAGILLAIPATLTRINAPNVYPWMLAVVLTLAVIGFAAYDIRTHRISNAPTLALAVFGLLQAITVFMTGGGGFAGAACGSAIAALIVMGVFAGFNKVGFGDAKLIAALTLVLGLLMGWYALYLLPLAFTLETMRRLVWRQRGRYPFAPAIGAAAILLAFVCLVVARA